MPRLGCVPYLNARPLLGGLDAELAVPSLLAGRFAAGQYDAALLPVFETLRLPLPRIADGFGICSFGPVRSVIVAHRLPLEATPEILLDPASRTSANLLRVLLARCWRLSIPLVAHSDDPLAARLLIGDPALEFQSRPEPGWLVTDLGRAWSDWTGLPFVFAVWTLAESAPPGTAGLLRRAATAGLAARPDIASREPDPDAALDYLTHAIRYSLGPEEKRAITTFQAHLVGLGLLPRAGSMEFV